MINPFHYLNKLFVFFNPDKASYWHTITRNVLDVKPKELGRYYLDFETKLHYPDKIDDKGVPMYKLPGKDYFYHPIVICQYALGIFEHLYRSGYKDEKLKSMFFQQVEWLEGNYIEKEVGKVWLWDYDIPQYSLSPPWFSALVQGEAASVLCRAYLLSKDERYLKLAEDAISPLDVPVKDGGLLNYFNGIPIYEEYPSPLRAVGNLCGFMFVLFGLYDLYLANNNKKAKMLFDKGAESLQQLLAYYDTGYWSRYFLFDYPKAYVASFTYHSLHFEQLMSIYFLTGEKTFYEYSKKWERYANGNFNKARALFQKLIYARTLNI
jgi:heparosan-N-sulfate-glucuronate 5-epimerase